jgi:hypothetical protein
MISRQEIPVSTLIGHTEVVVAMGIDCVTLDEHMFWACGTCTFRFCCMFLGNMRARMWNPN